MLKTLLSSLLALLLGTACAQNIDSSTVEDLDLYRFLGQWHEIARIDSRFERDLVNVTAHYSMNPDGSIRVVNRGYNTRKERWGESEAKAIVTSDVGRLRVSFFPMIFSDYNILSIDDNYQWMLIGSSSPNFLWILSRTSELSSNTLDHIITLAEDRGYDVSRLLFL